MRVRSSTVLGLLMIFLGAQAFVYRAVLPIFGFETGNGRLWPLILANVSLLLLLGPFFNRQQRGLGGMFIPAFPIMMASGLFLTASITNWWNLWENLWPLVPIALAFGFIAAAYWMNNVWLIIPAMIIGVNGLVFLFCSVTNLWGIWAGIWPIELLTVGMALLIVNRWVQSRGLATAGTILGVISGAGFTVMALVLSGWVSVLTAVLLIGMGAILVGQNKLQLASGQSDYQKEKLVDSFSEEDVLQMKESF